jgi:hypothetical protein
VTHRSHGNRAAGISFGDANIGAEPSTLKAVFEKKKLNKSLSVGRKSGWSKSEKL